MSACSNVSVLKSSAAASGYGGQGLCGSACIRTTVEKKVYGKNCK